MTKQTRSCANCGLPKEGKCKGEIEISGCNVWQPRKNPSDTLEQIKERWAKDVVVEMESDGDFFENSDAFDKMFSEIRELLDREITCKKCFVLDEWHEQAKELALKDKRIAELEAELTDKNLPPLEWAKIHAKDREQARSQGRNEAIAEIENDLRNRLNELKILNTTKSPFSDNDNIEVRGQIQELEILIKKLASMREKKAKA